MKYDFKKIERKWQLKWNEEKLYQVDVKNSVKPFYNLMMFPYPSAEGLHVGNMYAFTGSDIYGRYQRLKGYDVFEPIGLDGFGIHSENFAIKNKIHPAEMAEKTQKNFYKQLHMIGNSYDWSKTLETYDPEYYKWTQWLFIQMYKKGLAYKKKAGVNWCPSCMTVLSDEQVEAGLCERCKTEVVKKDMSQWFFKITDYAEKLLKNIDEIDWTEKTKLAQKNWIGKSEGAEINFIVKDTEFAITVFTTRPDTLYGCRFIALSPENKLIYKLKDKISNWTDVESYIKERKTVVDNRSINNLDDKTGVELRGIEALNPLEDCSNRLVSLWVSDYVLANYGTGAVMGVPAHDMRDFSFVHKHGMKDFIDVISKVKGKSDFDSILLAGGYEGPGFLVNSGKFNGMKNEEAKKAITESVGGKLKTNYKLRDWCISRQRFWGPPIPIVYCEKCGTVPVPEKDLPVMLPKTDDYMPDGTNRSPLARNSEFVKTKCPKCGGDAKRETDVSDTFLDSSWYFLRYPSVDIKDQPFDKAITKKWLPVDMYIGGHEHAVLHLLYTRFVTMVLHDLGTVDFEEPFKKFRAHGLIIKDGAKMSKSKGNVVNPDDYIEKYGADVLRTYLMFIGPLKQGGDFRDEGVVGIERFFGRLFFLVSQIHNSLGNEKHFEIERNKLIKKATNDIENLDYNTIIASLMEFLNLLDKQKEKVSKNDLETLIIILSPLAPHFCEEMWEMLGNKTSVFKATWPEFDESKMKEEKVKLIIQVNGKVRDFVEVETNISEEKASELVQKREKIMKFIVGKKIKKIIFVKGRLINIVV